MEAENISNGFKEVKKRDGSIAEFDGLKITNAIRKAVLSTRGSIDNINIENITEQVIKGINIRYNSYKLPDVEGIQDLVETTLMSVGLYDVAKAYILYRDRRKSIRESKKREVLSKIERGELNVIKRNNSKQTFSENKLRKYLTMACKGYEGVVDVENILKECEFGIYDDVPTSQISDLLILSLKPFIEKDPIPYSVITSRLFLAPIYKEVLTHKFNDNNLNEVYKSAFKAAITKGVNQNILSKEMFNFDFDILSNALVPQRDEMIAYRGLQTLYDRYFIKDHLTQSILELPQFFWMRVAMGLSINEKEREKTAIEFYNMLSTLRFVSSTPTLFHSGFVHSQLSSCYITTIDDDLHHIFKSIADNAQLEKWSGGLGNDWTRVRATGSFIKSTKVESQGVIPFLKIANDTTLAINRSGKRRGATCAYLELWHLDIFDFMDLRRNTGDERRRTHDMNTATWIPDLFMKRLIENKEWTLFSPSDVPNLHDLYGKRFEEQYVKYEQMADTHIIKQFKKIPASELWRRLITSLFETGHPWIVFKDPCNIRSPQDHVGVIHSSNLCTEITLNTSNDETAVCNLGSINLSKHIKNGKLDAQMLKESITIAMRMLDNVIDINFYPTIEAKNSNMRHRPVGLGIMGYQDALYLLNLRFESEEAVKFADRSMEMISYYAIIASSNLAKERGSYSTFKGSKWDRGLLPIDTLKLLQEERADQIDVGLDTQQDWSIVRELIAANGMRNSNCMAIAPTATISNIADCFPSIEPIYSNLYVKSNMSGEFTVVNQYLIQDLKSYGLWNSAILNKIKECDGSIQSISSIPKALREKYKTAFEIDPIWLLKAAAHRAKWIDQSQSLNIFTKTTSGKHISDLYTMAWKMGIKTTYYLRTEAASAVEKSTVDINNKSAIEIGTIEKTIQVYKEDISTPSVVMQETDPKFCDIKGRNLTDGEECESCQ